MTEVRFERRIEHPIEKVWDAIATPEGIEGWLGAAQLDLTEGGDIRLRFDKTVGNVVTGHVTEVDPPHVLAYAWFANWHNVTSRKTIVRWELSPKDGGTLVKVIHSGLAQEDVARKDYQGGWPGVVEQLKTYVEK